MGRFVTILSREEHSCEPLPGKLDRWFNGLKEGSVIKCNTPGCGIYWKLIRDDHSKLIWRER